MAGLIPVTLQDKWPIFKKYGLTKECIFQSMLASSYSGGNVTNPIGSSHTLDIIFKNIKQFLIDESTIKSIDRMASFPAMELPVVPKINDLIVDPALREWKVKDIIEDAADAAYRLRVRPIS